jgi:hypothetical protein
VDRDAAGGQFGDKAHPVTGVEIRNEVDQAIVAGATAIGYFTHRFQPTFAEFGVPEENQKAIVAINQQLQRLAPAILAADAKAQPKMSIQGGLACLAKEHDGALYIFALNLDMGRKGGTASVKLDGLPAGARVEVIDERRTLTADAGGFSDELTPLAVHIYKVKRP